jgi:Na+-translocating ferredoxin:NAD+ oxidoreductase RnfG subunit
MFATWKGGFCLRGKSPALARGAILLCLLLAVGMALVYPRPGLPFEVAEGEKVRRLKQHEVDDIAGVYLAERDAGSRLVQIVSSQGFKGLMQFQVDIDLNTEQISQVRVLSQQETEDYGGYVTEGWFLDRFVGKNVGTKLRLVKLAASSPEEVVAITGATVTSRGALDAVNKCLDNYQRLKRED